MDLDFDAPSLHTKFRGTANSIGNGGFVKYFLGNLKTEPEGSIKVKDIHRRNGNNSDLDSYIRKIGGHTQHAPKLKGTIHFLPAGDFYDRTYWDIATGQMSRSFLNVFHERELGRLSEAAYTKVVLNMLKVKDDFTKLDPEPDFLILDLRAGLLQLAITVSTLWADVFACFWSYNKDNYEYLQDFIPMIRNCDLNREHINSLIEELPKTAKKKALVEGLGFNIDKLKLPSLAPSVLPILSRFPADQDPVGPEIEKILDVCGNQRRQRIRTLSSDSDLEFNETLYLGMHEAPTKTRLTYEYIELFLELIKDDTGNGDKSRLHQNPSVWETLGIPPTLNEEPRRFTLIRDTGALINKDGTRNVSLKVETFQNILFGIRGSAESKKVTEEFQGNLLNAGESCGRKFGNALNKYWEGRRTFDSRSMASEAPDYASKIKEWCSFDSDVGFGRFLLKSITIDNNEFHTCEVMLVESFLNKATDFEAEVEDGELSSLMEGYCRGVISTILGVHSISEHHIATNEELKPYIASTENIDPFSSSSIFTIINRKYGDKYLINKHKDNE